MAKTTAGAGQNAEAHGPDAPSGAEPAADGTLIVRARRVMAWQVVNIVLAVLLAAVAVFGVFTFFDPGPLDHLWQSWFKHPFPFDISYVRHFVGLSVVLHGVYVALELAAASMAAGIVLGVLAGLARVSRSRALQVLAWLYIWVWRGTPLLVQLLVTAYGIPILLESMDRTGHSWLTSVAHAMGSNPFLAGFVALSLYEGAYVAEIVRSGILSVEAGQVEAARALGMRHRTLMRKVVLPQAVRVMIPPLGNNVIAIIKDTSLVSVIGLTELTLVAEQTYAENFRVLEVLFGISLYYLLLTTIWSVLQVLIERRFGERTSSVRRGPVDRVITELARRLFAGRRRNELRGESA
jgi:polar amino acid transport system permease protein